jgi:hypothetical protein
MKEKAARKFLRKNQVKIIRLNKGMEDYPESFKKMVKKCTAVLLKD